MNTQHQNILDLNVLLFILLSVLFLYITLPYKVEEVKVIEKEYVYNEPRYIKVNEVPKQPTTYTATDDLLTNTDITVDQMNYIIDQFYNINETPFKDKGYIFIEASKITGFNPLYIFAHASLESGYGTSKIAREKRNYFGIGAFDYNTNNAYTMGNSMREGIINGAKWIKENYYDKGYKSLYDMVYKDEHYYYSSTKGEWVDSILWIMNKYKLE